MGLLSKLGSYVFAGTDSAGNPRSVVNLDAQVWATEVERILQALQISGGTLYASKADLDADLTPAANSPALVIGDATAANNGLYQKTGSSGSGFWVRRADVPGYSYILAVDDGGTANAIEATTTLPIPEADGGALIALPIALTNTASPVTVAFNGEAPLTVKQLDGTNVAIGGLEAGMIAVGYREGANFRLLVSKGEKGDQGDPGPQGDDGPQGIQGDVGPQGPTGDAYESYGVSIYKSGGIALGGYYAERSANAASTQAKLYAEIIAGDAGSEVDFQIEINGAVAYGPVTAVKGTPVDLSGLTIAVAEGDVINFVITEITGAVIEFFAKSYGAVA